ncbi:hypothetical protein [Phormidesmis priestleyi]
MLFLRDRGRRDRPIIILMRSRFQFCHFPNLETVLPNQEQRTG